MPVFVYVSWALVIGIAIGDVGHWLYSRQRALAKDKVSLKNGVSRSREVDFIRHDGSVTRYRLVATRHCHENIITVDVRLDDEQSHTFDWPKKAPAATDLKMALDWAVPALSQEIKAQPLMIFECTPIVEFVAATLPDRCFGVLLPGHEDYQISVIVQFPFLDLVGKVANDSLTVEVKPKYEPESDLAGAIDYILTETTNLQSSQGGESGNFISFPASPGDAIKALNQLAKETIRNICWSRGTNQE